MSAAHTGDEKKDSKKKTEQFGEGVVCPSAATSTASERVSTNFEPLGIHVLSRSVTRCGTTRPSAARTITRPTANFVPRFALCICLLGIHSRHSIQSNDCPCHCQVRAFVDKELTPYCHEWDEAGTYPAELHAKAYAAGVYGAIWPKEFGGTPPEGTEAADMFHDLILTDELARCGAGGVLWACFFSFGIALPPVLSVGSQYLKSVLALFPSISHPPSDLASK
jgi:hypothetical protein